MLKKRKKIIVLLIACFLATVISVYFISDIDAEKLQTYLKKTGIWAPIIYITFYIIGTLLILPSTPLNLSGGALFGVFWGTLWTAIGAIIAAMVAFAFTRTIGRNYIAKKLSGKWEVIDAQMRYGGLFYIFAIRLLPLIPYGIVNFAAGLTAISFRDYLIGTALGTVPGILPFVMMGSGLQSLSHGNPYPLITAFILVGMLVGVATWYRHRCKFTRKG